jgi:hypothetical protein
MIKYENITEEQWKLYREIERACWLEDLRLVLEDDFDMDISELDDKTIDYILEDFDDRLAQNVDIYYTMYLCAEQYIGEENERL